MELLNVLGSWKAAGLGLGVAALGLVASFVALGREVAAMHRSDWDRRERWRSMGTPAIDMMFTGLLLTALAVVAMAVRWAVT